MQSRASGRQTRTPASRSCTTPRRVAGHTAAKAEEEPGAQPCPLSPQVYGADEVKAQIKLQCKTVTGKPFLVIRSFQLTRKRGSGKYEFKSLDQNIQIMKNNGEVRGRCRRGGRHAPARGGLTRLACPCAPSWRASASGVWTSTRRCRCSWASQRCVGPAGRVLGAADTRALG